MNISTIVRCASALPAKKSVLIRGDHGIGKSDMVRQLSKHFGLEVIDKRLSQISEGDMIGLPQLVDGVTRFAHPDWYVKACKQPVMLFFDEFNRATQEVMNAAFQIILDRELNGMKLHPDTRVFACINHNGTYQVNQMDPALLDRFWVCDLDVSVEEWLEWGTKSKKDGGGGIHPYLLDFIKQNPRCLHTADTGSDEKQPSPRSIAHMDEVLQSLKLYDADLRSATAPEAALFYSLSTGFVGVNVGQQLVSFIKTIEKQITAEDILDRWDEIQPRMKDYGQEKWNHCIDKLVEHGHENVWTSAQMPNLEKFYKALKNVSGELILHFWMTLAANSNPNSLANIKGIHPYVKGPILEIFNTKKAA